MNTNGKHPSQNREDLADYITTDEAAVISGYHVNYIRRLMSKKKLKGRKAGLVWLIERESLLGYMALVNELGNKKHAGITQTPQPTK